MADFYLDHNLSHRLVHGLESYGHVATTARRLGLDAASDDAQLLLAADRNWPLLTHNRKDFVLLHNAWGRWSTAWEIERLHPGILVLPDNIPVAEMSRVLAELVDRMGPALRDSLWIYGFHGWQLIERR